jgi:adenylate kinase
MKIILLGAPGSGKGTQAQKLHELLNYEVITASSVLRAYQKSGCELGKRIRSDMDAGILVSDDIVWQVIKKDISEQSAKHQKILIDGFPRSLNQLDMLNQGDHDYDGLIYLNVHMDVVVDRVCGRRVHMPSGRVYHVNYAPPKVADRDDITGEPLVHRADDTEAVVKKRLVTYHDKTLPIVHAVKQQIAAGKGRIKQLIDIDANQSIADVTKALIQALASSPQLQQ